MKRTKCGCEWGLKDGLLVQTKPHINPNGNPNLPGKPPWWEGHMIHDMRVKETK